MQRTRGVDFRLSCGPELNGYCQGDQSRIFQLLNRAQERLLYDPAAGEEGWHGSWATMVFSVDRCKPYVTFPRNIARIMAVDGQNRPIPLHNSFYEFLEFGDGWMPKRDPWRLWYPWQNSGVYSRDNAVTFLDMQDPPQQVQIYPLNPMDAQPNPITGAIPRVFIQGTDENNNIIYTQDGNNLVPGEFVPLIYPYASTINSFNSITGIQKDMTQGTVQFFQLDPTWGSVDLLLIMEPTETTANYRRYYFHALPRNCCGFQRACPLPPPLNPNLPPPASPCSLRPPRELALVRCLVKLDLVPVQTDTDYTLITSLEALIEEAQSVRFSSMDTPSASPKAVEHHANALRILVGQSYHFQGKNMPAVNFAPFGSARLDRLRINMK